MPRPRPDWLPSPQVPVWMHPQLITAPAHPDYDPCSNCHHPRILHKVHDNCEACVVDDTICYSFQPKED